MFAARAGADTVPQLSERASVGPAAGSGRDPCEAKFLRVLTWNVAGNDRAFDAPKSWTVRDKECGIRAEISRLQVDVLALQESPSPGASAAVPPGFALVGAVQSNQGYAQLYARRELGMERVAVGSGLPAVVGRCRVGSEDVIFACAHLAPHEHGAPERAKQTKAVLKAHGAGPLVLLGDLNVRPAEAAELCGDLGLRDMPYDGRSWAPMQNRFYENLADYRGPGLCFDRIWCSGALWAEGHLIGVRGVPRRKEVLHVGPLWAPWDS